MRTALLLALATAGCTASAPTSSVDAELTRDEARAMGGKQDGLDICEWLGWYGDGICDEFCLQPDPDCEGLCRTDADCPQIVCVRAPCPSFGCQAGECVLEVPGPQPQCVVGGCSGQTCYEAGGPGGISTCEFLPEYACYASATCERQPSGQCGWTPTPELNQCIADARHPDPVCETDLDCPQPLCLPGGPCPSFECVDGQCVREDHPATHCGGFAGFTCGEGEYCHYQREDMCGAADAMGTCLPLPEACTREYAPVCGCDGETYSNACGAHAAGTSVASEGECEPETCGGVVCGEGTSCQYCWGSLACIPDGALC